MNTHERLLAALWLPMESAPKNTKAILVWVPENRCVFCATWDKNRSQWRVFGGLGGYLGGAPTHWMPTPGAPNA